MRLAAAIAMGLLCALAGYSKTYAMRRRERLLSAFIGDMSALAMEVEYRPRELAAIAGKLTEGPIGSFWECFIARLADAEDAETAWRKAAEEYAPFSLLSGPERAAITEAGDGLGINGAGRQLRSVRRAAAECERLLGLLRSELERKGDMYTKLGLLGGAAMALVII